MSTLTQINIATQKASVEASYRALADAMSTDLSDVSSILMSNVTYPKADLIAKFQSRIQAAEATRLAHTALRTAVANERQSEEEVAPLRAQMKAFLALRFGKTSPVMQKFGFTQAKAPQTTVATKSAAVTKNKATRQARGTTGPKQKSKIKGAPPAPVITASPAAAASAGAPPSPPKPTP